MLVSFDRNYTRPAFQRRPQGAEIKQYTKAVSQGLKILDKKVGVIVHNSAVPSSSGKNLGIGSLLSKNAEKLFIPFLAMNAVTSIQQEPDNLRGKYDPSPYSPQSLAKNTYMLPVERLSGDEYAGMLDDADVRSVVRENNKRYLPNKVNYNKVSESYEKVLSRAYQNFTNPENAEKFSSLRKEFSEFSTKNAKELTPSAIYEILSRKNNNENWRTWQENERNLYVSNDKSELKKISKEKASEIDYFIFKQWLVDREIIKANKRNKDLGISIIGDLPVAFTPVEVWKNQDLFLDNLALGCPPDYFSPDGQRWDFAVLKPEKIFNADGSLGEGGKLLKNRVEKIFESSPGGVRIDHIIGLIDPFVYSKNEPKMTPENSGRLYSSPEHQLLGKYKKDTVEQYASIIQKIVIPAAEKYGLTKDDIICEDLGLVTDPVRKIMEDFNLSGISVTQYDYRGKETPAKNIIMPGSHDNESYVEYTDRMFEEAKQLGSKVDKLADDTIVPNENRDAYRWEMATKKDKFISSSFAELFTSPAKKVQLFFTTFFGMGETYNRPGTTKDCWTLRIPEKFEDLYWSNVKDGKAINLPEVIARAIRNKGEEFSSKHNALLSDLDKFSNILKQ